MALVHANDGTDVRIGKTCRSLSRLGFETYFVGWNRRPVGDHEVNLGTTQVRILAKQTPHGRWSAAGQAAFLRHIVAVLRKVRPDVVCAVNEELAFLLLPFKGVFYDRLVCEIYDALDARLPNPSTTLGLVTRVVGTVARQFADRLIVTDANRLEMVGRFGRKARILENVPEDPGSELAARLPEGPVSIWAAGTLDEAHGLRQLLAAVGPLDGIRIVSAGWPYDSYAADVFLADPRVSYQGVVSSGRALELAAKCDAVFCYYAPTNANMVNASPNKVYDALAVGRPILINREVKVSSWVVENAVGHACAYDDVASLRAAISRLATERVSLRRS